VPTSENFSSLQLACIWHVSKYPVKFIFENLFLRYKNLIKTICNERNALYSLIMYWEYFNLWCCWTFKRRAPSDSRHSHNLHFGFWSFAKPELYLQKNVQATASIWLRIAKHRHCYLHRFAKPILASHTLWSWKDNCG